MAGEYSALASIADPKLRAALKLILDRLGVVEGQVAALPATTPLADIADPTAPTDPVNLRTLKEYISGVVNGTITTPTTQPIPPPVGTPADPTPPAPTPPGRSRPRA